MLLQSFSSLYIYSGIMLFMNFINVNFFVLIILICIALSTKKIYYCIILSKILKDRRKLTGRLDNLPVHPTSSEDYFNSRQKVDQFIKQTLNDEKAELILSSSDLNNLYLKGIPVNKYCVVQTVPILLNFRINRYLYFEIEDEGILETTISYPSFYGKEGVFTRTDMFRFYKESSQLMIERKTIETNDRDLKKFYDGNYNFIFYTVDFPLIKSNLLFFIFDAIPSPDRNIMFSIKNDASYKNIISLIEKIDDIHICENCMVIRSMPNASI